MTFVNCAKKWCGIFDMFAMVHFEIFNYVNVDEETFEKLFIAHEF